MGLNAGSALEGAGSAGTGTGQGTPGQSAYVYIRYADDDMGTGFSDIPLPTSNYIGILSSTVAISSITPDLYNGLWAYVRGLPGEPGLKGDPGPGTYTTVAYADTAQGDNFSYVPLETSAYVGIVTTPAPIESDPLEIFQGKWLRIGGSPSTGPSTGYTTVRLKDQPGGDYAFNLAAEGRFLVYNDGTDPAALTFTNPQSLGTAVVALRNDLYRARQPVTWPSNLVWDGGVAPTLTTTPGRGDVLLFRSWNGSNVTGRISQTNVFFEADVPAGTTHNWRFISGADALKNSVSPGSGDIATNTGTIRSPLGVSFAATQRADSAAIPIATVNFGGAWTIGMILVGAYANAPATGNKALGGINDTVANEKYVKLELRQIGGVPSITFFTREGVGSTAVPVGASVDRAHLRLTNEPIHFVFLSHDGAGQFSMFLPQNNSQMYDAVTLANTVSPQNYIAADTTKRQTFPNPVVLSFGGQNRAGLVVDGGGGHDFRRILVTPRVLTAAERNETYDSLRTFLATTDPTSPQLPARV